MPFQSEKQRRYLWANEPEIARDWTDTYGSRIHKNEGGIMQAGVKNYLGKQKMVDQASLSSMNLPRTSGTGQVLKGFKVFVKVKG